MRVKLQGGPMHNKVVELPDSYRIWTVSSIKKSKIHFPIGQIDMWPPSDGSIETITSLYEMLVIQNPIRQGELIPCVSPKGEVYFKHRKKK